MLVPNPDARWQITEGTRESLRSVVQRALDEGWSTERVADEVTGSHAFSETRAQTIARTEIARADVEGALLGYRQSGVVRAKRWLTALDDKVSEECQASEAAGAIGLDESFPPNGVDGPPNHPNCRCAVLPVLDDELPVLLGGITEAEKVYDPDQPRDERGRWTNVSGSGSSRQISREQYANLANESGSATVTVAALTKDVAEIFGTDAAELLLSSDTVRKQLAAHPDVTAEDYARVGSMLDRGEIRRDGARHFLAIEQDRKSWISVIKVTVSGESAFLVSLRRTKDEDLKRLRAKSVLLRPSK